MAQQRLSFSPARHQRVAGDLILPQRWNATREAHGSGGKTRKQRNQARGASLSGPQTLVLIACSTEDLRQQRGVHRLLWKFGGVSRALLTRIERLVGSLRGREWLTIQFLGINEKGRVETRPLRGMCWETAAQPTASSRLAERHRDKHGGVRGLHPHQHLMFALGFCLGYGLAHIVGIADCLATDIKDNVAGLDTLLSGGPVGIDGRDDDTLAAGAGNLIRRFNLHSQMRHAARRRRVADFGSSLPLIRHLAEFHCQGFCFTLALDVELDRSVWRRHADRASKFAQILHWLAVDRSNDVAGFDSGSGCRTVWLRLVNHRSLGLLHAEILGDARGHRLNLHAQPTAADVAVLL